MISPKLRIQNLSLLIGLLMKKEQNADDVSFLQICDEVSRVETETGSEAELFAVLSGKHVSKKTWHQNEQNRGSLFGSLFLLRDADTKIIQLSTSVDVSTVHMRALFFCLMRSHSWRGKIPEANLKNTEPSFQFAKASLPEVCNEVFLVARNSENLRLMDRIREKSYSI